MSELGRTLAVIPARGGSKGVPRKNLRLVQGRPLIVHTIETVLPCLHLFSRVIVSTDDSEIAAVARQHGVDVPFLRPAALAGDRVAMVDVLQHAVRTMEQADDVTFDWIWLLQPTSPLRSVGDLEACQQLAVAGGCDSVISVRQVVAGHPALMKRIEDNRLLPFSVEEVEGTQRQDLSPPAFVRNGAIYLTRRTVLMEQHSIWGQIIRPYVMPEERSVNVDGELDVRLLELMLESRDHRQ